MKTKRRVGTVRNILLQWDGYHNLNNVTAERHAIQIIRDINDRLREDFPDAQPQLFIASEKAIEVEVDYVE